MSGFDSDESHLARLAEEQHRRERGDAESSPSLARQLARVGVLGWLVITPMLAGLGLGRWLDHLAGSGIFWTGPLLLLGLALGCWSGWHWMHRQ